MIKHMQERYPTLKLRHYIESDVLERISKATGVTLHEPRNGLMKGEEEDGQHISEEEIDEEEHEDCI